MTGSGTGRSEVRSWDRSLPVLANDLLDAGLDSVEMIVEYQLPLSSKRVDVVLAGTHPRTGDDSYVVVELKQWSAAECWEDDPNLVLVDGMARRPLSHPVRQVRGYCEYLADMLGVLDSQAGVIKGAAYLHNATEHGIQDLHQFGQDERGRLFTGQRRGDFVEYLQEHLAPEPGSAAADRFLRSQVRPSRQLLAVAADELKDREQFVLLAEQRLAYDLVLHEVETARSSDNKEVVVVTGGPGSGKSAIALSLLGELSRQGRTALHATGSKAFTETLRARAGKGSTRLKSLFKYFNSFMSAEQNGLEVLICDESHRIRDTSANRFTPATKRTGRAQVDELISAARVPVFLLDEHQTVRPGEKGTVESIKEAAAARNLAVHHVALDGQFRCGGSESYEQWVLRLLGLDDGGPEPWDGDDRFEVVVAQSPMELEALLRTKHEAGYSARMSAGFCWPWSDPREDGSLVPDVKVDQFWAKPWNLKKERSVGNAPGRSFWATDPLGFDQVGCIYTAQGFEYDWSGVIIGPDLVARDGRLVSVREENRDPAFRSRKSVSDEEFDLLVRQVYKVLLTRGMRGIVLYATDPATTEFLSELVERPSTSRESVAHASQS